MVAKTFLNWGFRQSIADACVFDLQAGIEFNVVLVVLDDMVFATKSMKLLETLKE